MPLARFSLLLQFLSLGGKTRCDVVGFVFDSGQQWFVSAVGNRPFHGVLALPAQGGAGGGKRWFGVFFPLFKLFFLLSVRTLANGFLLGKMECQLKDRLSVGPAPGVTLPCAVWREPDAVALFIVSLPEMSHCSIFNHMG